MKTLFLAIALLKIYQTIAEAACPLGTRLHVLPTTQRQATMRLLLIGSEGDRLHSQMQAIVGSPDTVDDLEDPAGRRSRGFWHSFSASGWLEVPDL
jgi:hypothetical protein